MPRQLARGRRSNRSVGRIGGSRPSRWVAPELLDRLLDSTLVCRACTKDPALRLVDLQVVDARLATTHQAVLVELPQLVAVAAPPLAVRVVAFVLVANRDPVLAEGPEILA